MGVSGLLLFWLAFHKYIILGTEDHLLLHVAPILQKLDFPGMISDRIQI